MGKDVLLFLEQKNKRNWTLKNISKDKNSEKPYLSFRDRFIRFAFGDISDKQLVEQLNPIKSLENFLPDDVTFEVEHYIGIHFSNGINLIQTYDLQDILNYDLNQPFTYKTYTSIDNKIEYELNGVLPNSFASYGDDLEEVVFSATLCMFISNYWKDYFLPLGTKFKNSTVRIISFVD